MKFYFLFGLIFCASLCAQTPVGVPAKPLERVRLEQEYMAKRAEWVSLRSVAMAKIKEAKTEVEKKNLLEKLETEERALRVASADLGRRLREARQAQASARPAAH